MAFRPIITNILGLSGAVESGGLLYTYALGTTTPLAIYTDSGGVTPATNPVVADSLGQITAYFDDAVSYTWHAKSANGATTFWQANVVGAVLTLTYVNPAYTVSPLIEASWIPVIGAPIGSGWPGLIAAPAYEYVLDVRQKGLVGDGIRAATGVATAGDATFTDSAAAWVAADVGKLIAVIGAGAAGAPLVTTIASRNSATSIELTIAPSTTVASSCVYVYGTDNTTAMAALKTYVAAETYKPRVDWTAAGRYLYTASPNWYINDLTIDFASATILTCLSTSGGNGFEIDSGSTLASGYCWGVQITGQPQLEMLSTGGHAVFLRGLLRSSVEIRARGAGATKAAFRTDFCVGNDFTGCAISNNDQQPGGFSYSATPAYGIWSTRRGVGENSAHNFWGRVIVEGTDTGVDLDYSTGEVFEAGTIEGCTLGIHGTANTVEPRFIDIDVEQNTVDLDDDGMIQPIFDWYDADRAIRRTNKRFGGGHIYGLTMSNNGSDATNDIDFATGNCRDSTDRTDMYVHTGYTKRSDATFVAGTNQGMLDTGAIGNNWYYTYVILKDADGSYDFLCSLSATAPTMPSGYTYFRRIGAFLRTAGAIVAFTQIGNEFLWKRMKPDVSSGGPSANNLYVLSVPLAINALAKVAVAVVDTTPAARTYVAVLSPDQTDPTSAGITEFTFIVEESGAGTPAADSIFADVRCNTAGQIRVIVTTTTADHTLFVNTHGWIDTRGQ